MNKERIASIFKKFTIQVITLVSVGFVFVCWFATYFTLKDYNTDCRGTFGDMFGGINALFSGLAFCGIIISILLQSSELRLQREEIKENRAELARTTQVQTEQSKSLSRQAENMKISAKLSALNTLVIYYSERAQQAHKLADVGMKIENERKAKELVKQIEKILKIKDA